MTRSAIYLCCIVLALLSLPARAALDASQLSKLAADDNDAKVAVVKYLASHPSPEAQAVLTAMDNDALYQNQGRLLIVHDDQAMDAATLQALGPVPDSAESIIVNNRLRGAVQGALSAFKLFSSDLATRLKAARDVKQDPRPEQLPLIQQALAKETNAEIHQDLLLAQASIQIASTNEAERLAAVKILGGTNNPEVRTKLADMLIQNNGQYNEASPVVRAAAQQALKSIDLRISLARAAASLFSGLSLGSVLLLAALGLAITYGVMGVINMAHGELLMVGAYATYFVQGWFKTHLPQYFDWYVLAALPIAFLAAAGVGMVMERLVIRRLYGRPLETLLATWGISLILIQLARASFGAQNVDVANPSWLSGGIEIIQDVVLPWNRIIILGFSMAVLAFMSFLLSRTRLGLFMRAVTQNRAMAGALGVPAGTVDTLAFGLGAGIAGLGGVALSQISNVGPDMGQGYIVDSFMVVVLGGVGQIAGTVYAALGLGIVNKLLESWSGAVIAKIVVLVFIILFIQKRPQGLFALKGRSVD